MCVCVACVIYSLCYCCCIGGGSMVPVPVIFMYSSFIYYCVRARLLCELSMKQPDAVIHVYPELLSNCVFTYTLLLEANV